MANFDRFMKSNKIEKQNTTYAATKSLTDESGSPMVWEIKPLSTKQNDTIRDDATYDVPIPGKPNMYRQKLNTSKYIAQMICGSIVAPNLYDKDLQNSYGAMTPEDLLKEMVNDPGEYGDFAAFIQQFNGFTTLESDVDDAKN